MDGTPNLHGYVDFLSHRLNTKHDDRAEIVNSDAYVTKFFRNFLLLKSSHRRMLLEGVFKDIEDDIMEFFPGYWLDGRDLFERAYGILTTAVLKQMYLIQPEVSPIVYLNIFKFAKQDPWLFAYHDFQMKANILITFYRLKYIEAYLFYCASGQFDEVSTILIEGDNPDEAMYCAYRAWIKALYDKAIKAQEFADANWVKVYGTPPTVDFSQG